MHQKGKSFTGIFVFIAIAAAVGFYFYQNPGTLRALQAQYLPQTLQYFPSSPEPDYDTVSTDTTATPTSDVVQDTPSEAQYSLDGICNEESCLFTNNTYSLPVGFGKLTGYYTKYETEAYGEKYKCDALVVTSGNQLLIDSFNRWIKDGNRINTTIDNNLVVNLSLENVGTDLINKIKSSTPNNKVEIGVISRTQPNHGISACYSFVEILTAK